MKKGESYRGFKVLSCEKVEEVFSDVIHLKHESSGLEVIHLHNSDEENLFSFNFRTPASDSTGVAHIIEHTVLCGSEKYPLKDPFMVLSKQSLNTFLNAMTGIDRTMYPGSSVVKSDYFNLMSVYADAVFFPLLKKEAFMQEGIRVELDSLGKPVLQGVVYNEMKGRYSSFDYVSGRTITKSLLHKTSHCYNSGGDPLEIPDLTYSRYRAFHKKYYCPANCLVFLYGSIPTEEQLDFLCDNVLCRIKDPGKKASLPKDPDGFDVIPFLKETAPLENGVQGQKSSVVNLNFLLADALKDNPEDAFCVSTEALFMSELFTGSQSAPVARKLIESGLGTDLSTDTGVFFSHNHPYYSIGLLGADEKDAGKIQELILDSLTEVSEEGISRKDFDRVVLEFEFSHREELRFSGPQALTHLYRAVKAWCYGNDMTKAVAYNRAFHKIKEKIQDNPSYISDYIKKNFLNNRARSLTVVTPSSSYSHKREKEAERRAKELYEKTGKKAVESGLRKMAAFQNAEEDEGIIPRIQFKDLTSRFPKEKLFHTKLSGIDYIETIDTFNSLCYVRLAFPFDMLSAEDYFYIPLLSSCLLDSGWKGVKWFEAEKLIKQNFSANVFYEVAQYNPDADPVSSDGNIFNRDLLLFNFKCVTENTSRALDIFSECIRKVDFSDTKRIKSILSSMYDNLKIRFTDVVMTFGLSRLLRHERPKREILDGISQILFLKKLLKAPVSETAGNLRRIYKKITAGGSLLSLSCSRKDRNACRAAAERFIKASALKPMKKKILNKSDFLKLTEISGKNAVVNRVKDALCEEVIEIPGSVGYAFSLIPAEKGFSRSAFAFRALCHLLSSSELWQKIRMEGGSYGVSLSHRNYSGNVVFETYRDPVPFKSLEYFNSFLPDLDKPDFSPEEIEKVLTGLYSEYIEPEVPRSRTRQALHDYLYGYSRDRKSREASRLLKVTLKDVEKCAVRLSSEAENIRNMVFCPSSLISAEIAKMCRKIIKLQL